MMGEMLEGEKDAARQIKRCQMVRKISETGDI